MIKNRESLLDAANGEERRARSLILDLVEKAIKVSDPRVAVRRAVSLSGEVIRVKNIRVSLRNVGHVYVVGAGKASGAMTEALEEFLKDVISGGVVCVQRGTAGTFRVKRVRLLEGEHPVPDKASVNCAREILKVVEKAGENDIIFCLISGGGSALMAMPADGLGLEEMQEITLLLLRSGATIREVNTVRRHLSKIKGGRLAEYAHPAKVISLIISDVVGDALEDISSGPTAPDPTSFSDAIIVLRKYGIWEKCSGKVRALLKRGKEGKIADTPKPGNPVFRRVSNVLIATNRIACNEVAREAARRGVHSMVLTTHMEGEAREVGCLAASILKDLAYYGKPLRKPALMIMGGETTVTVEKEGGKGGRNQELALSAALRMSGIKNAIVTSFDTDGIDGFSHAAGALVDGRTIWKGERKGLNAKDFLKRHDSTSFFELLGDGLIVTGPTGTNVNDILMLAAF